jgi:phosphatidylinositol glycan class K
LSSFCLAKVDPDSYLNNIYVIISSSKFYFNYRHSSNPLSIYHTLKARGIRDDKIFLFLPENHACNARNLIPGTIYMNEDHQKNLYCNDIEVDYKGTEVTAESILNLFRGRYHTF